MPVFYSKSTAFSKKRASFTFLLLRNYYESFPILAARLHKINLICEYGH